MQEDDQHAILTRRPGSGTCIAESTRLRAQAEADAIAIKAKALRDNPDVIRLNAIEKWDGKLPQMMTGNASVPFVTIK